MDGYNMTYRIGIIPIFAFILFIGSISLAEAGAPLSPAADMIFVVDESGSMALEQAFLAGNIVPDIDSGLQSNGIGSGANPNGFGLVGFGTGSHGAPFNQGPHKHLVGGQDFGTSSQFATAAGGLITSGGFEDGYEAMTFATGYNFQGGCPDPRVARQIVVVTDEDRDVRTGTASITFNVIKSSLENNCITLNAIVNANFRDGQGNVALGVAADGTAFVADGSGGFTTAPGGIAISGFGTTIANYVNLAHDLGGAAWDLNQLRVGGNTAKSFAAAILDIKIQEIEEEIKIADQKFKLIGHDADNSKHILIDIATGAATNLGPTTFDSFTSGLAASRDLVDTATSPTDDTPLTHPGGTLFGVYRDTSGPDAGKDFVIRVDTTTGEAVKLVEVVGGINTRGVAFGPNGGFFATEGTTQTLYTIDMITGVKTTVGGVNNIGNIGFTADNIQFDTGSSPARFLSLTAASPDSILSIDPTTGVGTKLSQLINATDKTLITLNGCALAKNPQDGRWFTVSRSANPIHLFEVDVSNGEVTSIGDLNQNAAIASANICGLAFEEQFVSLSTSSGGVGHEPPTIGKSLDGVRQIVDGGISVDDQTWTVTQGYHQEFELLQMLSSPHTISNVIHCAKGVLHCNYIAVGFMLLTDDFNNPVMTVSASKDHLGAWTLGWYDPADFISDPGDATPGNIVFVPQIIDNNLLGTSFTIDFKNKDTGQLKLGIQVRDSYGGVRNFYFNEGVQFIDADAYPAVETAYEAPVEVESLCFGQNNPDRNSCQFAKMKDWATQNAEETLKQMMGNQYEYEQ